MPLSPGRRHLPSTVDYFQLLTIHKPGAAPCRKSKCWEPADGPMGLITVVGSVFVEGEVSCASLMDLRRNVKAQYRAQSAKSAKKVLMLLCPQAKTHRSSQN